MESCTVCERACRLASFALARAARSLPSSFVIEDDPAKALDLALRESDADDVILVVGSLFLVGEVRRVFEVRALQMTVAGMKRG